MTKKRFTKKDRHVAQKVIRTENDLIKEVGAASRVNLQNIVQSFTEAEVVVTFEGNGVLVHSSYCDIKHRLTFPFKIQTFYVSINWVQAQSELTNYIEDYTAEESAV